MDYYQILGFDDRLDMNFDTMKSNYKRLVVVFHPDKLSNQRSQEENRPLWNKIQDAFNTLSNDRRR